MIDIALDDMPLSLSSTAGKYEGCTHGDKHENRKLEVLDQDAAHETEFFCMEVVALAKQLVTHAKSRLPCKQESPGIRRLPLSAFETVQ